MKLKVSRMAYGLGKEVRRDVRTMQDRKLHCKRNLYIILSEEFYETFGKILLEVRFLYFAV